MVTPGLMAATESHQGSLGAKTLWYFRICVSWKSNVSVPSPAVGFKRCCELPTPCHIDRQMFLTHVPLHLRSYRRWWQHVCSLPRWPESNWICQNVENCLFVWKKPSMWSYCICREEARGLDTRKAVEDPQTSVLEGDRSPLPCQSPSWAELSGP